MLLLESENEVKQSEGNILRQAIITKALGPTNHLGQRVKASCDAGSFTMAWDHALSTEGNHSKAAALLAAKLEWTFKTMAGGGLPNNGGYAYILVD
jgi:hypothetical protein